MSDDPDTDAAEFESTLAAAFREAGATDDDAETAAEMVASFREDFDEDLTADDVLETFESVPYEEFDHRYDAAIGELAAATADCTDSRAYRLSGFGDLAADPQQGA